MEILATFHSETSKKSFTYMLYQKKKTFHLATFRLTDKTVVSTLILDVRPTFTY